MDSISSLSHHFHSRLPLPSSTSLSPLPLSLRPFPLLLLRRRRHHRRRLLSASDLRVPHPISHPSKTPHHSPPSPPTTPILDLARKSLALLLFSVAIGFLPHPLAQSLALAAPVSVATKEEAAKSNKGDTFADHEFSTHTRKLLSAVSVLLERIEEVRASKGDLDIVREALKEVKERRKEIQGEVLGNLNAELRELRKEREELVKKSSEVMDAAFTARKERDRLLKSEGGGGDEVRESVERLERRLGKFEEEYNGLWERIGEIEDRISKRETLTFSIAIRELSFIERESELLVERFSNQLRQKDRERYERMRREFFYALL